MAQACPCGLRDLRCKACEHPPLAQPPRMDRSCRRPDAQSITTYIPNKHNACRLSVMMRMRRPASATTPRSDAMCALTSFLRRPSRCFWSKVSANVSKVKVKTCFRSRQGMQLPNFNHTSEQWAASSMLERAPSNSVRMCRTFGVDSYLHCVFHVQAAWSPAFLICGSGKKRAATLLGSTFRAMLSNN